ncbi:MAG: diguanylate cyclase [Actinobacteria bacterium]|nr:diguanylate cyclase [Actinomycetota bacterium]
MKDQGKRNGTPRRATDSLAAALADEYLDRLLAADRQGADEVIDRALRGGIEPAAIHVLVIGAAMENIGRLWEVDKITVADEHLATAISHQVLIRLIEALHTAAPGSRENVLLAAIEGQHHVLGLRMVADVLEGAGYNVLYLGPDVPVDSLRDFAAQHNPVVTGLSYAVPLNVNNLAESVFAVREAAPMTRVMLGGRAAPRDLGATGIPWIASSLDVLDRVRRLIDEPPLEIPALFHVLRTKLAHTPEPVEQQTAELEVAERLANIAAQSSEISREYARRAETYRDLSLRDPVTDLANRRAFDDKIHSHTRDSAGQGALLLIDVDEFKYVNDTFGHDEGDRQLVLVAHAIADTVRPNDFCARIGGDEFAVLLPVATLREAHEVGERVRRAVAERADRPLTVSVGATPVTSDARATLMAVDEALYAAKSAGRDTVIASGLNIVANGNGNGGGESDGARTDIGAGGSSGVSKVARARSNAGVGSDTAADAGAGADVDARAESDSGESGSIYVSMSRLQVSKQRADELVEAFRRRAGLVDGADGFLGLEVWQSDRDEGEVLMVSHWQNRDAFKAYMKSGEHQESHGRIDPDLKAAIKLMRLEHMHTYKVVAT